MTTDLPSSTAPTAWLGPALGVLALTLALPAGIALQRLWPSSWLSQPTTAGGLPDSSERAPARSSDTHEQPGPDEPPAQGQTASEWQPDAARQIPPGGWPDGPAVVYRPAGDRQGTVRAAPGFRGKSVTELPHGTAVVIDGRSADRIWQHVRWPFPRATSEGWMHRDVLRPAIHDSPGVAPQAATSSPGAVGGWPTEVPRIRSKPPTFPAWDRIPSTSMTPAGCWWKTSQEWLKLHCDEEARPVAILDTRVVIGSGPQAYKWEKPGRLDVVVEMLPGRRWEATFSLSSGPLLVGYDWTKDGPAPALLWP